MTVGVAYLFLDSCGCWADIRYCCKNVYGGTHITESISLCVVLGLKENMPMQYKYVSQVKMANRIQIKQSKYSDTF